MWDAADVMRMGKDLFIQHGLTTNRAAMDWFQRYYPEYRVHAVNFPGDPYPIHIDATFVPLRPGLIINNPHRPLPEPQPPSSRPTTGRSSRPPSPRTPSRRRCATPPCGCP